MFFLSPYSVFLIRHRRRSQTTHHKRDNTLPWLSCDASHDHRSWFTAHSTNTPYPRSRQAQPLPRGKSVLPRRREVAPFRQGSKSIPQIQTCERAYRKFGPEDGNLAKTSGLSALGERAPSVATSAQDARCPSRAVAQKCAPPARTSPDHQPRSIDLSNKNRITPTWTIPLSSCCGGLKPDTTTIFRKKSPLARSDAVS